MKKYFDDSKEIIVGVLIWGVSFTIYLFTLAPTVQFIDSGELATVASTLGVAHPTGYPLFTLLGRIFSLLPTSQEPIVRLHFMSALLTSLAAMVFFFVTIELFRHEKNQSHQSNNIISASFASLALACSQTFWGQGVAVEVYALHVLLIMVVMFSFLKAIRTDEAQWWLLFAFTLGLSFANHLTTILLAPAFLVLFFWEHHTPSVALKRIAFLSIPFIAGLSLYLYLPIRASSHPLLNWGNPQTLEKFWWHFTGKQFRVWMFSSTDAAEKQLNYFLQQVSVEFYYVPLIFSLMGFLWLAFSNKKIVVFISLLLVSCVAYSINYDIHDIDSYFLLAFISLMVFSAYGVRWMLSLLNKSSIPIFVIILSGIIILEAINNWPENDQSHNYIVEDYTTSILTNLPPHAIILSYQWDYFVSASYYLQHVKKIRPDVVVLDKELFRRSWYISQLQKMYPSVMATSKYEAELFLNELNKFEHDLPYEYGAIEGRYRELLHSIISKNINQVPCFVTAEIEPDYTLGYNRIPYGFGYLLTKDTSYVSAPFPTYKLRPAPHADTYTKNLLRLFSTVIEQRSQYEKYYNRDSLSLLYHQKYLQFKVFANPSL